jgi:VanZ family protein
MPLACDRDAAAGCPLSLWFPVLFWAALIAVSTSTPGSQIPRVPIPHVDLAVHSVLYGVLGFLLYRAFHRGTRLAASRWAWLVAFAVAQTYGILDEVHQTWIPDRTCSLADGLADGIGAAVGIWIFFFWFVRRRAAARPAPTDLRP